MKERKYTTIWRDLTDMSEEAVELSRKLKPQVSMVLVKNGVRIEWPYNIQWHIGIVFFNTYKFQKKHSEHAPRYVSLTYK